MLPVNQRQEKRRREHDKQRERQERSDCIGNAERAQLHPLRQQALGRCAAASTFSTNAADRLFRTA
jgi:hypothetical protein